MGKVTNTVVSKRNEHWISKNRYFELKYFCFQYNEWIHRRAELDGMATVHNREPTESEAIERAELSEKIRIVQDTAAEVGEWCKQIIIDGVTSGMPYDKLNARNEIPCGRQLYYKLYRQFFYILSYTRN